MPIAWPPEERGADWNRADAVTQKLMDSELQVDVTNLGNVGAEFDGTALDPGIGFGWTINRGANLRCLGFDYEGPTLSSQPNPAQQFNQRTTTNNGVNYIQYDWARSNTALTGVSRDSTGAVLGLCSIDLFTLADQVAASAVSDASGNFSFSNPGTGPFYIVAYKAGSPDVAGTTANTLLPTAV